LLSNEDFDSVKVESSSVITIEKFIDTQSIDPVYYDAAYCRHATAPCRWENSP
jgi:non-homologous end joining protein Ku